MTHCCIALGANLGDPAKQFESALACLDEADQQVLQVSQNFVTPAMGDNAGSKFHNAAAIVDTSLPAEEFLLLLHDIEARLGRQRTIVWGPRSLDLDLLLYEDTVIQSAQLMVPHPLFWFRRFVLDPLNEIATNWMHPTLGETVCNLSKRLNERPLQIEIHDTRASTIASLVKSLSETFTDGSFELTESEQDAKNPFATVIVEHESQLVHSSQPNIESSRILHPPAKTDLESFLRDILTAALPHDQLIAK